MNRAELKQFITDFYQAWKERDKTKIAPFYDKNLRAFADYQEISMQDIYNRLEYSLQYFAETNYYIEDEIIDEKEGKVALRMKQRHIKKDGEIVKWDAIFLYKVAHQKITEIWMSFFPTANYTANT